MEVGGETRDHKHHLVRITRYSSEGTQVSLLSSRILTVAIGFVPQRFVELAVETVVAIVPQPASKEPNGISTRLKPIVRQAKLLNAFRCCFGSGIHLKFQKGVRPLMLAAVLVAMPVLWPQPGSANGQTRMFVTESTSWSVSGEDVTHDGTGGGSLQGGAKPQTAEIMKTISKRRECKGIVVTINRERADYILILERVGGRDLISKDNKMALFDREGDMVASSSTRSLGNAVKDACVAIQHR